MNADSPSRSVLFETPGRALQLLTAVGRNPGIQHLLARRGWSDADYQEGWRLLLAASGYKATPSAPVATATVATRAIAEIDAWDEPNFRIAAAALKSRHPAQYAFVFDGLEPAQGPGAILSVTTFLDRLDVLESGKGRDKALHKGDLAALETLAKRGIDPAERKRLRGLLAEATSSSGLAPEGPPAPAVPAAADGGAAEAAVVALYNWYDEWAEVARTEIKRRDYLIRMGLAVAKRHAAPAPAEAGDAAKQRPATGPTKSA